MQKVPQSFQKRSHVTFPSYPYLLRRGFEEADEFCPFCDNHFVIEVVEKQPIITVEGDDPRLLRDHRMKQCDMAALEELLNS